MSGVRKRSIRVAGHPTSVSLEDEFWDALGDIAARRATSLTGLIEEIDAARGPRSLSSAIRLFVLDHVRR